MVKADAPHILLINPWIHDFAAYDFWAKPLGLLILAGMLREAGLRVSFIDCLDRFHPAALAADPRARCGRGPYGKTRISKPHGLEDVPRNFSRYGIHPEWFRQSLGEMEEPDLVLVTSLMTYWYTGVRETIEAAREIFPAAPVVLGGVYATLCPEHAASRTGADRVFTGPGEADIYGLIRSFTGFAPEKIDSNTPDGLVYPAFDMQSRIPYVPLLTSRGCPFSCAYCASNILDPTYRRKPPAAVAEEIRYWHGKFGVEDFAFYDDALLVRAEDHAVPLLEEIVRHGPKVRFHTPNAVHIRGITRETASLMKTAGFETLRLGLETAASDSRDDLDRKATTGEFLQAASLLREAGFRKDQVGAYLLVGLPGQSLSAIARSVETVKQSGITPIPTYYSPIPGTPLWKQAVASSRYDLESDPIFTNNAVFPCRKEPFSWEIVSRVKAWCSG